MRSVISRALALIAIFALSASALAGGNLAPQTSSQSGVTVKVTPRSLSGSAWEFAVVFDTHSQDLKDDPVKSAVLVVDGGAPSTATGWEGDAPGGHHRKGVLRFKATAASPANVELRLHRPAESEPRVFRWQLR
ncbi:MAG TPA: hypothetical protein VI730_00350 [Burkholderiales bacterium]|jgi:hypothetical protein|nr:hypothetical protein [Burkholderiales bacterium]